MAALYLATGVAVASSSANKPWDPFNGADWISAINSVLWRTEVIWNVWGLTALRIQSNSLPTAK